MSKSILEKLAIGLSLAVLVVAVWFWSRQLDSVLELLEMAG